MTDQFIELLQKATASIPRLYFQLPVAGQEQPIFRERVYCYELYHQLRALLEQTEPPLRYYALSGEVDKQGHRVIRRYAPDLIFHQPGDMSDNIAVVEVKPANGEVDGIRKDLATLAYFVSDAVQYRLGIHLVY